MVYCGRPSRGCQMCRTRRIKCDETKPTCKQCAKSRRQCPGYKHDFDIVFRNETSATKRRVNRGLGTKKKSHDQITFRTGYNNDEDKHNNESRSLAMTYREGIGAFEYLIPIIKVEPRDSPISLAFAAVSLASLANRPNSRSGGLMIEAMTQHGKALKAINIALQTSITQKTDATLASILLLGFFETLTSEKTNMLAWGSHIDGAAQLTKIRGKKQLRTKTGLALFVTVRDQMLVNCISASKAPLASAHWWINVQEPSERGPDAFVAAISLRVAELRFEANDLLANSCRTPELLEKVNEIMKRAQAMDIEFQDWAERLPKDWLPQPVAWIDNIPGGDLMKSDIYPGRVDLYSDLIIAHTWNSARTCRLFIIGLIIRCVAWLGLAADYKTKPEYKFCHKIGSTLMTDIIASIPYHLGWPMDENGDLKAGDISSNSCHARDDPVSSPKALGGFYCIWPAFCVTSSDYATDSQRSWVKGRLRLIADLMGLNQARVVADYELRLPSMVVARDGMSPTPPTATQISAYMAAKAREIPLHTLTTFSPSQGASLITPESHSPITPQNMNYNHNSNYNSTSRYSPVTSKTISRIPGVERYISPTSLATRMDWRMIESYASMSSQQQITEDSKREEWEREKKKLLRKASNFGGDSEQTIIGNYLAI